MNKKRFFQEKFLGHFLSTLLGHFNKKILFSQKFGDHFLSLNVRLAITFKIQCRWLPPFYEPPFDESGPLAEFYRRTMGACGSKSQADEEEEETQVVAAGDSRQQRVTISFSGRKPRAVKLKVKFWVTNNQELGDFNISSGSFPTY